MAATVYLIKINGVALDTYTNKGRALAAVEGFVKAADELGTGDLIEVVTQKTGKVIFTYLAANVIAEANKITADKDAHTMRLSEFQALEDAYINAGVVTLQYVAEEALSVPVVGVIQDKPGNVGITHYHAPGCRDIQREMTRYGQSASDLLLMNFESVAEILIMEMGDVSSDYTLEGSLEWYTAILENSNGVVLIMPCLKIPAGRMGDAPLVTKDNFFRAGFDHPNLNTGTRTYDPMILCSCGTSLHDNAEARKGHEDNWHSEKSPAEYNLINATNNELVETLVTKEYQLEIIVDDISGAVVDLGWHTFTVSAEHASDVEVIANMYGELNGSGVPRHGWGSIIGVVDICDI